MTNFDSDIQKQGHVYTHSAHQNISHSCTNDDVTHIATPASGVSSPTNPSQINLQSNRRPDSISGKISSFMQNLFTKEHAIIAAKVFVVAVVAAALITASVFTFGAAGAIAGATLGGFIAKGALIGAGVGLVVSGGIATPLIAHYTDMFKATDNNLQDTMGFLAITVGVSTGITAFAAAYGAAIAWRIELISIALLGVLAGGGRKATGGERIGAAAALLL